MHVVRPQEAPTGLVGRTSNRKNTPYGGKFCRKNTPYGGISRITHQKNTPYGGIFTQVELEELWKNTPYGGISGFFLRKNTPYAGKSPINLAHSG